MSLLLYVYIGPKKESVKDTSGGHFTVFPLRVVEGERIQNLQARTDCTDVREVRFVRLYSFLGIYFWRTLRLPAPLRAAVVRFLHEQHAKQDTTFDCYSFACFAGGVKERGRTLMSRHWLRALRRRDKVGDIVFLMNKEPKRFHAAVCLGSGLYLSVWGAGGDLEVATLPDMLRDFAPAEPVRVVPRPL